MTRLPSSRRRAAQIAAIALHKGPSIRCFIATHSVMRNPTILPGV